MVADTSIISTVEGDDFGPALNARQTPNFILSQNKTFLKRIYGGVEEVDILLILAESAIKPRKSAIFTISITSGYSSRADH